MSDYPTNLNLKKLERLERWIKLRAEQGVGNGPLQRVVDEIHRFIDQKVDEVTLLPGDRELAAREPNGLDEIHGLRPDGSRRIWDSIPEDEYHRRLSGAINGRFAGCVLGSPVELNTPEDMEEWASYIGDPFPPTDYWSRVDRPSATRYAVSLREHFARRNIKHVPSDDDIAYTILGLLIIEEFGPGFSTADVATAWQRYLRPDCIYTAERITFDNLRRGVNVASAGDEGNRDSELIGAGIRCDPWAYVAPGWPEKAAELAWRDAVLSHRRSGIYGAMYFAAAISAAFTVDDPVEALWIGLEEIPAACRLAQEIRWALQEAPSLGDFRQAHVAVSERFSGMNKVHTINNAVLTVWGITIGAGDYTRTVSETVAMGYDNDCTAATAGSLVGAAIGIDRVPERWYELFNNQVKVFLNGANDHNIDDLVARFAVQARGVFA